MTGNEYMEIMNENGWKRSKLVRLLENQIAIFNKNELDYEAEEVKWLIFDIAEREQRLGMEFIE